MLIALAIIVAAPFLTVAVLEIASRIIDR